MIESGLLVFFLIPGLLAYCGLFGTFDSGRAIAPEPPPPSSIEVVTIVLLASAIVHVTSGALVFLNDVIRAAGVTLVHLPAGLIDPYAAAFHAMDHGAASGRALGGLIGIALLQGAAAFALVRLVMRHLARQDRLPSWIYGWATGIANAADNDDTLIVAYVLTTHDHDGKAIVYAGVLYDMALKSDGNVARITLWDCERYLANLSGGLDEKTLPAPSSRFPFLILDAGQIRNIAFEIVDLTTAFADDAASVPGTLPV